MAEIPKVNKQERQLMALPREFRAIATWAWTELKPAIANQAISVGATPIEAQIMAARLARLVASQLYGDVTRARALKPLNGGS